MYDAVLIQIRTSSNTRIYCKLYVIISCALFGSLVLVTDTGTTINDATAIAPDTVLNFLDAKESTVNTNMTGTNHTIQGETPHYLTKKHEYKISIRITLCESIGIEDALYR